MNHRLGMRAVGVLAGALAVSGCTTQLLLGGGAIAATRLLGGPQWRHDAFAGAERFAVHMLPVEDKAMSDRFAWGACRLSDDEFAVDDPEPPRLRNAVTRLTCRTHDRIVMGDHLVIVGRVEAFDTRPGDALTYFRGKYGKAVDPTA